MAQLYDGYCASTCTLFSEFMRLQAGVKSIAMGGRPVPASTNSTNSSVPIIQAIGGVKGANNDAYGYLTELATYAYETGTDAQKAQANWTVLTQLMNTLPVNRSTGKCPCALTPLQFLSSHIPFLSHM